MSVIPVEEVGVDVDVVVCELEIGDVLVTMSILRLIQLVSSF